MLTSILNETIKMITILLLIFLNVLEVNILMQQYYSPKRMIRSLCSHYSFKIIIFLGFDILSYVIFNTIFYSFYHLFAVVIFIILFGKVRFHFTRRSCLLILVSSILSFVCFLLLNHSFLVKFVLVPSIIIISYYLLLPLELLIQHRYVIKARTKISKMKNMKIIGITGSFGKSSFRNYLTSVLKTKYLVRTPKNNINTFKGLTKYINDELEECDILILELGVDSKNQMRRFKKLFTLDFGVITSVGNMHLATFKNVENVLNEKLKIKNLLSEKGILFLNQDNEYLAKVDLKNTIFYSKNNVNLVNYDINGMDFKYEKKLYHFNVHQSFFSTYLDGVIKIVKRFNILSKQLYNLSFVFSDYQRRNQVFKIEKGYLIDNSYNANLEGIKSSLSLVETLEGETYIVTGGIIEQGKNFEVENKALQKLLKDYSVIFIGEKNHPLVKNGEFKELMITKDISHAYKLIRDINPDNILLLAKGDNIFLR